MQLQALWDPVPSGPTFNEVCHESPPPEFPAIWIYLQNSVDFLWIGGCHPLDGWIVCGFSVDWWMPSTGWMDILWIFCGLVDAIH